MTVFLEDGFGLSRVLCWEQVPRAVLVLPDSQCWAALSFAKM